MAASSATHTPQTQWFTTLEIRLNACKLGVKVRDALRLHTDSPSPCQEMAAECPSLCTRLERLVSEFITASIKAQPPMSQEERVISPDGVLHNWSDHPSYDGMTQGQIAYFDAARTLIKYVEEYNSRHSAQIPVSLQDVLPPSEERCQTQRAAQTTTRYIPKDAAHGWFQVEVPAEIRTLCIVGNVEGLGLWNPKRGIVLQRHLTEPNIFIACNQDVPFPKLPNGTEFKFCYQLPGDQEWRWEQGDNREIGRCNVIRPLRS